MEEKIVLLNDDELDGVVGGAYNPQALSQLGLETKTGLSGAQGLHVVDMSYGGTTRSGGWISDASLRSIVSNNENVSLSVKTTSGETKNLTQKEIASLLS